MPTTPVFNPRSTRAIIGNARNSGKNKKNGVELQTDTCRGLLTGHLMFVRSGINKGRFITYILGTQPVTSITRDDKFAFQTDNRGTSCAIRIIAQRVALNTLHNSYHSISYLHTHAPHCSICSFTSTQHYHNYHGFCISKPLCNYPDTLFCS